jgi:hypothetical protein
MSNASKGNGSRPRIQVWDVLTVVVLILTVCIAGYFMLIFFSPNSPLNMFPPGGSMFAGAEPPTATPAPIKLEPTWTASPTLEMTATNTAPPTWTPLATYTPFSLVPPTRTPKPTSTPKAPFTATVTQVESTLIHPEMACNWAGVGGTVTDSNNSHLIGMVVVLRGTLDGKTVDLTTVTGINKEYGPSGYEFVLGSAPVASSKTLYVQLVDQSGIPLSDKVEISTSTECTKNLVLVRFKKTR